MSPQQLNLIVPYVADGGSDRRVRLLANYLEKELDSNIRVENIVGAVKGYEKIARSVADGMHIGMIANEVGMMHWFGETDLTPTSFTPLGLVYSEPSAIIVRSDSQFSSLEHLLTHIRSKSVVGTGSPSYGIWKFGLDGLLDRAGIPSENVRWIPTASGEEGVELVIAGHADLAPVALAEASDFIKQGSVRGLATMATSRSIKFPEVPTVREAIGVDWKLSVWRGFVAPAGLPKEATSLLIRGIKSVACNQDFLDDAQSRGFALDTCYGEDFRELMLREDVQLGNAIQRYGKKANLT